LIKNPFSKVTRIAHIASPIYFNPFTQGIWIGTSKRREYRRGSREGEVEKDDMGRIERGAYR
jgi:hypothetical protein